MLEKLAEMVREQADEVGLTTNQLCFMCEHSQEECLHNNKATCINAETPNGSFRIARWAVLLVAKGLEKMPEAKLEDLKERKRVEGMPTAEYMCAMSNLGINFLNLLSDAIISERAEAEEGTNE